ncbi:hypothetical protein D9611_008862 [Ephemerocybe angulata]|uniref:Uncharacterized protein n=1 Tax=Ephemerocybe angulata TaxID=980116 RepID=A0A8H5FCP2_9AGAR|nr:hypothetical protein D9611_008862 [Tulosesus angulatus]
MSQTETKGKKKSKAEAKAASYDTLFPHFRIYGEDPNPPLRGTVLSRNVVPIYGLGWIIYWPHARHRQRAFKSRRDSIMWSNWEKHKCKPSLDALESYGLMTPDITMLAYDYIFVRVGCNTLSMLTGLQNAESRDFLLRQATLALGLVPGTFDPLENLVWKRWPKSRTSVTQELDLVYPCKWRYEWRQGEVGPDVKDVPPHSIPENIESLPHLPEPLVCIVDCPNPYTIPF